MPTKKSYEKARKDLRKKVPEKKTVTKPEFEKARKDLKKGALQQARKDLRKKVPENKTVTKEEFEKARKDLMPKKSKPKFSLVYSQLKKLKFWDNFDAEAKFEVSNFLVPDYMDESTGKVVKPIMRKVISDKYDTVDSYKEFRDKFFKDEKTAVDWFSKTMNPTTKKGKDYLKKIAPKKIN
jgi:uncharacterized short protein YbdD (DUF466 family)